MATFSLGTLKLCMISIAQGSPFSFTLTVSLSQEGTCCKGQVIFDGQVNGFMKMLIEKPLTSLFEQMGEQMKAHFEQN